MYIQKFIGNFFESKFKTKLIIFFLIRNNTVSWEKKSIGCSFLNPESIKDIKKSLCRLVIGQQLRALARGLLFDPKYPHGSIHPLKLQFQEIWYLLLAGDTQVVHMRTHMHTNNKKNKEG